MLALGFKSNQRVEITTQSGEVIVVHVIRINQGSVRLAFDCDRSTKIVRGDLLDKKVSSS